MQSYPSGTAIALIVIMTDTNEGVEVTHDHDFRLRLYLMGGTEAARHALSILAEIARQLGDRVRSEVIDVLMRPELFLDPALGLSPLFVRLEPAPVRSCPCLDHNAGRVMRELGLPR